MDRFRLQVAIDGPAGSGKSSVAKALARRLGRAHIDTGALYRAVTLCALREGIECGDGPALAERLDRMRLEFAPGGLHCDGEDVSSAIRGADVTAAVSTVAANGELRERMSVLQRRLASEDSKGCVLEGRDIGMAILPLARTKIYLDADPRERARRRALQMGRGVSDSELSELEREMRQRDEDDSRRTVSPLQIAPDAHVVDTTHLGEEEVVDHCLRLCRDEGPAAPEREVEAGFRYHNRIYALARAALTVPFFFWLCGMRVFGREHERVAGSLIYACNHISNFDPCAVGSAVARELHYLAKQELFFWPLGPIIRAFNAIPIRRGRWDAQAFERAERTLAQGRNMVIFPEGTRRPVGRPGPVKKGLGILAVRSGRPYVPVLLRGTARLHLALFQRGSLQAWIGPAVELRAVEKLRESLGEGAIHDRVGRLYLSQLRTLEELARERR